VALFNRGLGKAEVNLTAAHLKFSDDAPIQLRTCGTSPRLRRSPARPASRSAARDADFRGEGRAAAGRRRLSVRNSGDINVAADGVTTPEPDPMVHRMIGHAWSGTRDGGERPTYAGWGGARADATPYDQTLQIAGRRFDTGIGILANSRLEIRNARTMRASRRWSASTIPRATPRTRCASASMATASSWRKARPWPSVTLRVRFAADIKGVRIVEIVARSETLSSDLPLVVTWGDAALRR
jgi:alpha-galactosidase